MLWNLFESFGKFWNLLASFKSFWILLDFVGLRLEWRIPSESLGIFWNPTVSIVLEQLESFWNPLESLGIL